MNRLDSWILGLLVILVVGIQLSANSALAQWPPTFSAPAPLNVNAISDSGSDEDPDIATDGQGHWVAVWESAENLGGSIGTDNDILVARSNDNGATWSLPAALNTNASVDSGADYNPRIATDRLGNWVVVWSSRDTLGGFIGTDLDILVARSTDNGATWTAPTPLNTNATTDSRDDDHPHVGTDEHGNWIAVWESEENIGGTIGTDWDILTARSVNNGATWTPPAPLNSNASVDSGADNDAQIATDGLGQWITVWESTDSLGGNVGSDEDIFVARSTDNGATWTPVTFLNSNAGADIGKDFTAKIVTDSHGHWVTAWYSNESLGGAIGTDDDILVARSSDNGATWTAPVALNSNAVGDSGNDEYPRLSTDGLGNWIAVWGSADTLGGTKGSDFDTLIAHSADNGATWTAALPLNTNGRTDSGDDRNPAIATDRMGHWVGVWQSNDILGGTVGSDNDILLSRFIFPECVSGGAIVACPASACGSCGAGVVSVMPITFIGLCALARARRGEKSRRNKVQNHRGTPSGDGGPDSANCQQKGCDLT